MKWIGQHIWDFISRFRTTVYIENLETSSEENVLVVDSDGKVTKNTTLGGADLTYNGSTANGVLTYGSSSTIDVESELTYGSGSLAIQNSSLSSFVAANTGDSTVGGNITLKNSRGGSDGEDDDILGTIQFLGVDDGTPSAQIYASIKGTIADATSGQEAGKLSFYVAEYDGTTTTTGLMLDGDTNADGEIDVTIGAGAASTATIAGTLTMGSTAFVNNTGVVQVATQGTIDHDSLANFVANEHIDWTASSAGTVHATNYSNIATADLTFGANRTVDITAGYWLDFEEGGNSLLKIQGGVTSVDIGADEFNLVVGNTMTHLGTSVLTTRRFNASSTTDGNHMGDVVYFGSGTVVVGKIYHYKSDGSWELAVCTAVATCDGLLGVALASGTASNVGMLLRGMVTLIDIQGTETVGGVLYLSETGGGGHADIVAPSASDEVVRIIGYCLTTDDQIWFNPDNTFIEIA